MEDIRRISLQEVRSRGWVIIFGKVYNLTARGKKSCWCEAQTSGLVAGVRTASQWDCNGGEPRRLSYWALRLRETHAAKQATVAAENK